MNLMSACLCFREIPVFRALRETLVPRESL